MIIDFRENFGDAKVVAAAVSGGSDSIGGNFQSADGLTYLSSPALNNLNESGDGSYEKQGA